MPQQMPSAPELGLEFMDRDHAEFMALVKRMLELCAEEGEAAADALTEALQELLDHSRAHFGREEEAMRESGFPAYPIHRGEHEGVLERFAQILDHWRQTRDRRYLGDIIDGEILPWFHQHLQTMDAATAAFILQAAALNGSAGAGG